MTPETLHRPPTKPPAEAPVAPPPAPAAPPSNPAPKHESSGGAGWFFLIVLLIAAGVAVWWWYSHKQADSAQQTQTASAKGAGGGKGPRVIPIVAATASTADVPIYLNGLGTVAALNTVTVRTRVDGELQQVAYTEGQFIKQGELLAQVDPRPFQVQLMQAEGQLLRDQAQLEKAQRDLERYRQAGEAISKQQIDTAESLVKQYEGAVKTDQGQIDNAKLQITYSRIVAPITGRIGLRLVDQGNIVHANDANGLAVITQVQPISVIFSLPQDNIPQLMRRRGDPTPIPVEAFDRDMRTLLATGKVLAIDNQVDPTSGTIRVRAEFANDKQTLYPSQFVNARMLVDVRKGVTVVPSAAIQRGPFNFVYTVQSDQTVDVRPVTTGPTESERTVVETGLKPGETVAIEGVDKLQKGAKVTVKMQGQSPAAGKAKGSAKQTSGGATSAGGGGESKK